MSHTITVIVPVYNVEKHLEKCIESIINQKYKDLEIILVNDGSKDRSGEICDYFSKKDNRIKVIHKENEGVSIARNTALNIARGEYVTFVDGDDYIDPNMYSKLYETMNKWQTDLVMSRFYRVFNDGRKIIEKEPLPLGIYNEREIFQRFILPMIGNDFKNTGKPLIMGSIWRCLYKKQIIKSNKIEFPVIKIAEDMLFHLNYLCNCKKVYSVEEPLYFYVFNNESATKKYITELWSTLREQLKLLQGLLNKYNLINPLSLERLEANTIYFISWCFTNESHPKNPKNEKEIIKEMKRIRNTEEFKMGFKWKNILSAPFKERCIFICIKLGLYRLVLSFNRKKLSIN